MKKIIIGAIIGTTVLAGCGASGQDQLLEALDGNMDDVYADESLTSLADAVCDQLYAGEDDDSVIRVMTNAGLTEDDANTMVFAAVEYVCPAAKEL